MIVMVIGIPWYYAVLWMVLAGLIFAVAWTAVEILWDRLLDRSERKHLDQLNEPAPVDIVDRKESDRG